MVFQLAWVLDFCLWPEKWEMQISFEIGSHLANAPEASLNRATQNILIPIEIEPLVLDMKCWYSYLKLFREEYIYDLESCIVFFLIFCNLLLKRKIITFYHVLSSQNLVSLKKRCTAALITLTQMHIAILLVFGSRGKQFTIYIITFYYCIVQSKFGRFKKTMYCSINYTYSNARCNSIGFWYLGESRHLQ